MKPIVKAAQRFPGDWVTAAETVPFGPGTQIIKGEKYRIRGIRLERERESGEGKLIDVSYEIIDDRGKENSFSYKRFR